MLSGQQQAPASSQTPAPANPAAPAGSTADDGATKFQSDVNVVNLFATVRKKDGKIVNNLTKDDFVLDEEGRPQTIKYFSQESNLPLTLGLLVDTSGSQRNVLDDERSASYRFFDQILREDRDLAFVLHFDSEVELLQDLTASRQSLEKALDALTVNNQRLQQRGQNGGGQYPGNGGGGYPGGGYPGGGYPRGGGQGGGQGGGRRGGTDLYDAVLLASDELMSKQKGRKALIILSDGVDTGSKTTLFQSIESAQKSDSLVYSILFSDPNAYNNGFGRGGPGMGRRGGMGRIGYPGGGYPGGGYPGGGNEGGVNGKKILEQISRETGGKFFQVSRTHPLQKIYAEIEEDLRNQYSIGYTPDQPSHNGVYRHVHLTAKKKDMVVVAREGYYAA
jgi:VWFA-related protein